MTVAEAAPRGAPLLRAREITVRFGSVAALSKVDFDVRAGTVHALVGENGAGKSTLMRVLSGAVRPEHGALQLDGVAMAFASPRDARRAGIRMIHQELSLVPDLSVAHNIYLGTEPSIWGVLDRGRMRDDARALLATLGEDIDPDVPVRALSLARREMVEIAKALAAPGARARPSAAIDVPVQRAARPLDTSRLRVLILDEPTAILSARETEALFARVAVLRDAGVGIVYCSHRLEEIDRLADEVTVLRDGVRVAQGVGHDLTRAAIVALMVDRAPQEAHRTPGRAAADRPQAADALRVDHLESAAVHDVSLTVRAGEIVGLVGLVGAGRTELARAVIGADARRAGEIYVDGHRVAPRTPADAMRAGIAYVSEDRKAGALIPQASVRLNITLARLRSFARGSLLPVIDRTRERTVTTRWVESLRIKIAHLEQPVSRLSGGNQQKVVLARWLIGEDDFPRVLIADEPTRGVDVGARADIHGVLRDLAGRGAGVLLITSDLEEALAIADRLLVMREGRIAGELPIEAATASSVASLMIPGSTAT